MFAATIAAVVGALCCIGPLILITLGLGGAWVAALSQFHAIHPYAAIITASFLGFAFWRPLQTLYLTIGLSRKRDLPHSKITNNTADHLLVLGDN